MKKVWPVLATALAVCIFLSCCGGKGAAEDQTAVQSNPSESSVETVPEGTKVPEETKAPEVTIAEAVVYDAQNVKITVKGMEPGWMGTDIRLEVENHTDQNIALSGDNVVVNGVTMSAYLYIDVAAGKKANGVLSLYADSLETAGMEQIGWLQTCDARIVDTDSYTTITDVDFEIVTSLGRDFVQPLDEAGELLYESGGIQVIAKVMTDAFYGKTLVLFVKNGSDKDVIVQAENISVNGFTVDAWMHDFVSAGTVRFCDLDLWESGLKENGIEAIEDITFTIQLTDPYSFAELAQSGELQVFVGK